MYNRYIRNDRGIYTRVPQEEPSLMQEKSLPTKDEPAVPPSPPKNVPSHQNPSGGIHQLTDGLTDFLRHVLDQFHLNHVDTGDLLLLGLLFLLFREDADEELLVALGLLLIL